MHRKQLDFLPWSAESFCRFPLIGHQARRSAVPATVTLQGCFHDSLRCSVGMLRCVQTYMHKHTSTLMPVCTHMQMHSQTHTSTHVCLSLRIRMPTQISICPCATHIQECTQECTYSHAHIPTWVCVPMCRCLCTLHKQEHACAFHAHLCTCMHVSLYVYRCAHLSLTVVCQSASSLTVMSV